LKESGGHNLDEQMGTSERGKNPAGGWQTSEDDRCDRSWTWENTDWGNKGRRWPMWRIKKKKQLWGGKSREKEHPSSA